MRTQYEHTCKNPKCNRRPTFKSTNKEQDYCSQACYFESKTSTVIEKQCPVCLGTFVVYPSHAEQVHCSTECYYEHLRMGDEMVEVIKHVEKANPVPKKEHEERFKPVYTRRCGRCQNKFRQGIYEKPQEFCESCR